MKLLFERFGVERGHAVSAGWATPHWLARLLSSAPSGGWKTTMSPRAGLDQLFVSRSTRTRWPTASVGTIDGLGIRYGFTSHCWIASASPSATTTITTSSTSAFARPLRRLFPPFSFSPVLATDCLIAGGASLVGLVLTGRLRLGRGVGGVLRPGGLGRRVVRGRRVRLLGRPLPRARLSGLLGLRRHHLGRLDLLARDHRRIRLRADRVRRLDERLLARRRAGVLALAHARAAPDAPAQVVELGASDVAAGRHLDALDLRRMDREGALHPDAERLLPDRERLARPAALALDHGALEHLRPPPRPLHDLEVHLDAIARLEARDLAQLLTLEGVDNSAHGNRARRGEPGRGASANPSEELFGLSGGQRRSRRRDCSRRQAAMRAWSPDRRTSGTRWPRQSGGRV